MALRPRPPRAWVLLRDRFGGHALEPTDPRRAETLRELFGSGPGEDEHAECSLEYGRDGGPAYHVVFTRGRGVRFEEWAHPHGSVDAVLTGLREASGVSDEEALELWRRLAVGDVDAVKGFRWHDG